MANAREALSVASELMMQEMRITITVPLSTTSSIRQTPGSISSLVPIITIASAPAAWALVRPNIIRRSSALRLSSFCVSQAANHLVATAVRIITKITSSVAHP